MRRFRAFGLVMLGCLTGAGAVMGIRTDAQVYNSMEEMNARFVVGKTEQLSGRLSLTFIKDKQTGDCYLSHRAGDMSFGQAMLKTDDNACTGF